MLFIYSFYLTLLYLKYMLKIIYYLYFLIKINQNIFVNLYINIKFIFLIKIYKYKKYFFKYEILFKNIIIFLYSLNFLKIKFN